MRAVEQRDELEIETRLRAALQARSELVTHSSLRPGIPPNEHTAGVRARRDAWWSWRRMWVPVTVAAALAGGVFVGAQLPSGSSDKTAVSPGGGVTPSVTASTGSTDSSTPPMQNQVAAATPANVGTLAFNLADGWQVTKISDTSGCVTPKTRPAPAAAADSAALPCGVDGLYLKADAAPTAWPLSTATKSTGWWPAAVDAASDITCPAAQSGSTGTAKDTVKDSVLLRSSTKYALTAQAAQTGQAAQDGQNAPAAQATAEYHEWAVTCDTGSGVQPMLWKLNAAPGAAAPATFAVATVVSADPEYDSALLGMVGSLHQAS